jgi:hypothetical protein
MSAAIRRWTWAGLFSWIAFVLCLVFLYGVLSPRMLGPPGSGLHSPTAEIGDADDSLLGLRYRRAPRRRSPGPGLLRAATLGGNFTERFPRPVCGASPSCASWDISDAA